MITFEEEKFYTPEQVAKKLQLSLTTVYNLIKSHQIPAIQIGKSFRITETGLSRLWRKKVPLIPPTAINFVERLKAAVFCNKIVDVILFGSYARGEPNRDSDIDLLVLHNILSDKDLETILRMETDAMESTGYVDDLSVLDKSVERWEALKKMEAGIYCNIRDEGVSLWQKSPM